MTGPIFDVRVIPAREMIRNYPASRAHLLPVRWGWRLTINDLERVAIYGGAFTQAGAVAAAIDEVLTMVQENFGSDLPLNQKIVVEMDGRTIKENASPRRDRNQAVMCSAPTVITIERPTPQP